MKKTPIASMTIGSALAAALLAPAAFAGDMPFTAKALSSGYQLAQADKKTDGKCGEAKCGAEKRMQKKAEGSCGGKKTDASCGAKPGTSSKAKDGKCGEAKCGADKK